MKKTLCSRQAGGGFFEPVPMEKNIQPRLRYVLMGTPEEFNALDQLEESNNFFSVFQGKRLEKKLHARAKAYEKEQFGISQPDIESSSRCTVM